MRRVTQSRGMAKAERKAAWSAWRRVPRADRVQALKLAKRRLPHPDSDVAVIVLWWAHAVRSRRTPPFVLPLLGVAEGAGLYFMTAHDLVARVIGIAGCCFLVAISLLAWNARNLAKLVIAAAADAESEHRPVLTVELDGVQRGFGEGGD